MKNSLIFLIFIIAAVATSLAQAAEWQWSVPADDKGRCAYLWIPPSCQQVRGLIFGDQNMIEEPVLTDPIIREAAAKAGLGILWMAPKTFPWFKYKEGADKVMLKVFEDLARESGYSEIKFAPLIPIGHSASTPFCWYVGYWNPARTIAIISLKGAPFNAPDFDKEASVRGIPAILITGEYYEWPTPDKSRTRAWELLRDQSLAMNSGGQNSLWSFFVDVSRGHFDWTDDLAHIVALYITKAAQYRLPAEMPLDGPTKLKTISPESGWLTDPNTVRLNHVAPASYKEYRGNPAKAFWAFDKQMADAMDQYDINQKRKAVQMVTFVQDGNLVPVAEKGYAPVRFEPMENDEMSFKVSGGYLEKMPPELMNQGGLSGHSGGPVRFFKTTGPAVQTGPDTFRIRFNRFSRTAPNQIWLLAYSEGDSKYRMAFQPGRVDLVANKAGKTQKITFPKIENQTVGTKYVELKAMADSNLPVEYYVNYGPAEVDGNRLILTQLPPRSKFPVKVSVAAYQWGRRKEPQVSSAQSVEQTFLVEKGDPNKIKNSEAGDR